MKIYELENGEWIMTDPIWDKHLPIDKFRQIDTDPTIAHTIQLESCNAVITKDSCYFRDAPAPVISLEEMQRVTRCMEMLREVGE